MRQILPITGRKLGLAALLALPLCSLFAGYARAQTPTFTLAVGVGTTTAGFPANGVVHTSQVYKTVVDRAGNIFVVGNFKETVNFGTISLTSAGDFDMFVAKLDSAGHFLWAKRAGNTDNDGGVGLAVDAAGNAYITGYYRYSATFGSTTLSGVGGSLGFIAKLDPQGNYLWAKDFAGPGGGGAALAFDMSGNVLLNGSFTGTVQIGNSTITATGSLQSYGDNAFVAKLDPNGNWLWATRAGYRTGDVAADAFDNVYVSGSYGGTLAFGPHTLTSEAMGQDAYVGKLDPNGNWLWVRSCGGGSYDFGGGIGVDYAGRVMLSGGFNPPSARFGPTVITNRGGGNFDAFVAQLDTDGNWLWAVGAGGTDNDLATALTMDDDGSAYVVGNYQDYGPGATFGTIVMPNQNRRYGQLFVGKINSSGAWQWVTTTEGTYNDFGQSVAIDRRGGVYAAGSFTGPTVSFGATTLTRNPGTNTGFVARLGDSRLASVAAVTPPQGSAGTPVLIQGARLAGATQVLFNGVPAASFSVTSPTTIRAVVPAGASTGPVSVRTAAGAGGAGPIFQTGALAAAQPAVPPVSLWPNPVPRGGRLQLQLPQPTAAYQARFYSVAGKLMQSQTLRGSAGALSVDALPAGSYLLVLIGSDGAAVRQRVVVE